MKDKYVLIIENENNEITLGIEDYLTGTKIKFTDKELSNSEGFSVGWMCHKLIKLTKDKYRSITTDNKK